MDTHFENLGHGNEGMAITLQNVLTNLFCPYQLSCSLTDHGFIFILFEAKVREKQDTRIF